MTYNKAVQHNEIFELKSQFIDNKVYNDGESLRWRLDNEGRVCYIRGVQFNTGDVLMAYPVKVLKSRVKLTVKVFSYEEFKQFKVL